MRNDIQIKKDVYVYIKGKTIASMVNGKLYRRPRPVNSTKEDIVVSVLASEGIRAQIAEVLVNIYVADIKSHGQYEEDGARLEALANQSAADLECFHTDDYFCELTSQRILAASNGQEHVISHRLRYKTIS